METTEHINVKTRNEYRDGNQVRLKEDCLEKNYTSNVWGTFKQWRTLDRSVSKGQKGTPVMHPATKLTGKVDENGKDIFKNTQKWWSVFNEEQTEQLKS